MAFIAATKYKTLDQNHPSPSAVTLHSPLPGHVAASSSRRISPPFTALCCSPPHPSPRPLPTPTPHLTPLAAPLTVSPPSIQAVANRSYPLHQSWCCKSKEVKVAALAAWIRCGGMDPVSQEQAAVMAASRSPGVGGGGGGRSTVTPLHAALVSSPSLLMRCTSAL